MPIASSFLAHTDIEARKQNKEHHEPQMPGTVLHHSQLGGHRRVLLTTCQVQIVKNDGSTMKVRALLDSNPFTLFITESSAQCLHLQHQHHSMKVIDIGSCATQLSSHEMVELNILNHWGKTLVVEAVVLPKVPICTPGSVDLLLGADIFSCTMLQGWGFGLSGSPSAFKTCFSWMLVGATHTSSHNNSLSWFLCCFAMYYCESHSALAGLM